MTLKENRLVTLYADVQVNTIIGADSVIIGGLPGNGSFTTFTVDTEILQVHLCCVFKISDATAYTLQCAIARTNSSDNIPLISIINSPDIFASVNAVTTFGTALNVRRDVVLSYHESPILLRANTRLGLFGSAEPGDAVSTISALGNITYRQ